MDRVHHQRAVADSSASQQCAEHVQDCAGTVQRPGAWAIPALGIAPPSQDVLRASLETAGDASGWHEVELPLECHHADTDPLSRYRLVIEGHVSYYDERDVCILVYGCLAVNGFAGSIHVEVVCTRDGSRRLPAIILDIHVGSEQTQDFVRAAAALELPSGCRGAFIPL